MKGSSKRSKKTEIDKLTDWKVIYDSFDGDLEKLRESLCTLGNGYMGIRGAATEATASEIHYPGTYLAGVFNSLATDISGKKIYNEDLVNCPDFLLLNFGTSEDSLAIGEHTDMLSYKQELDLEKGVLSRDKRIRDEAGHIFRISEKRIVHMAFPHISALSYEITPENYSGDLLISSSIDGTVENSGVERYRQLRSKHLKPIEAGTAGNSTMYLTMKTSQSDISICQAARTQIFKKDKKQSPSVKTIKSRDIITGEIPVKVREKETIRVEKICSVYTSRDIPGRPLKKSALEALKKSVRFNQLERSHISAWKDLWEKCDIVLKGELFPQTALRFHIFHLLQSSSPHNTELDAGIGARGLHGESYRGHIFWDEIFVFPFTSTHLPETAEALLMYRYRRLNEARKYAQTNGYKGSMFPWQSGSSGKEETQSVHLNPMSGKWGPDLSRNQRHVSFAIAYNNWRHWIITRDKRFLENCGAEIILSIAQFSASLCEYSKSDCRYHTRGLMGPDEFHEKLPGTKEAGLKDNAYSNILIVWTLLRALEVLEILPEKRKHELLKKTGITNKDLENWECISRKINIIINPEGIVSQFDGYFKLKELNWEAYRKKYGNIHRLDRILKAEGRSPDDYKVSKQADFLMLFYLLSFEEVKDLFSRLGYNLSKKMLRDNYHYYEKRTSHGSTLSKVVHCYVAHLLGMSKVSQDWYSAVLKADIHDIQGGTTQEGIHAGIMGGSIDIALRAFAGVHIEDDAVIVSPSLPRKWQTIKFSFKTRGAWVKMSVSHKSVSIFVEAARSGTELLFIIKGKKVSIPKGKKVKLRI